MRDPKNLSGACHTPRRRGGENTGRPPWADTKEFEEFDMFRFSLLGGALAAALVLSSSVAADPPADAPKEKIVMAANRWLDNRDTNLRTEVTINGTSLGAFEGDREVDVTQHVKPGRNTIVFATTPTGAAAGTGSVTTHVDNHMEFKIGAVQTQARTKKRVMHPTLISFRNDKDWSVTSDGELTHPFGPNPKTPDKKTVVITYNFEYAGCAADLRAVKEGDYILKCEPYLSANPSVTPTLSMNGKSLGSFHATERALVVTDLLKAGDNEIRIATEASANQLADIDITFEVFGPVSYDVARKEFVGPKVTSFKAMQGWKRNRTTHVLEVSGKPGADKHERTMTFRMESAPK